MALGKPQRRDGYIAPKGGDGRARGGGYRDENGNVWKRDPSAHGAEHWDVQGPRGYVNKYPGGAERPGRGERPKIPGPEDCGDQGDDGAAKMIVWGLAAAGAGLLVYEVAKWTAAALLTPATGGASLAVAAAMP
jgi:hypothetical protein